MGKWENGGLTGPLQVYGASNKRKEREGEEQKRLRSPSSTAWCVMQIISAQLTSWVISPPLTTLTKRKSPDGGQTAQALERTD
eukprot:1159117-Pelagomonas_calceolata.AAC.14